MIFINRHIFIPCSTGCVTILTDDAKVAGIMTDGDIRRLLVRHGDVRSLKVSDVMKTSPILCPAHTLIPGLLLVSEGGI